MRTAGQKATVHQILFRKLDGTSSSLRTLLACCPSHCAVCSGERSSESYSDGELIGRGRNGDPRKFSHLLAIELLHDHEKAALGLVEWGLSHRLVPPW